VVIVHYNTPALLAACLQSLAALPEAAQLEVIVVDNGSPDVAAARAATAAWPGLRWWANTQNRGFAAASNQGLRLARGRYCCLLNSDTRVRPGALAALMAYLDREPGLAVAGPRLLNADGSLQPSCFRLPTLWRTWGDGLLITRLLRALPPLDDYGRWPHDRARRVESVSGACRMVRRAAMAQVGLLDERFFMYAEEADWCRRFRRAGWAVGFCPQATVIHLGGRAADHPPVARPAPVGRLRALDA
jgi:GT2 family glycosyltransferase